MAVEHGVKFEPSSRSNGWALPPHPLQFISWGCVIYFAIIHFTTLVPGLQREWQPAGYVVQGVACLCHVITHIVASTINPADPAVLRKRSNRPMKFDRQKHRHVIENQHCYLCDVNVGAKSKHCSSCNKCVSDFDHHCKWLNNCVGGRNYRWFISALVSAIVCCIILLTITLLQFTAYYTDREQGEILQQYKDFIEAQFSLNTSHSPVFHILHQPVDDRGWLAIVMITAILSFLGLILLIHLLSFHTYLLCKGISTYDYIVMQRDAHPPDPPDNQTLEEGKARATAKSKGNKIAPSNGQTEIEMKEKNLEESFKTRKKRLLPPKNMKNSPDYQESLNDSGGETPPPAASPPAQCAGLSIQNSKACLQPKCVKKKRKRKKKDHTKLGKDEEENIATIGPPALYKPLGFKAQRIEVPITPVMIHRSQEFDLRSASVEEYHSDSAESLKEIPIVKPYPSVMARSVDLTPLSYAHNGLEHIVNSVNLSPRPSGDGLKSHSSLFTFTQNGSAHLGDSSSAALAINAVTPDGSWSKGPQPFIRQPALAPIPQSLNVPPLDLSALRNSVDSNISYQPYSGLRSSSDTYRPFEPFEPSERPLTESIVEV